MTIMRAGLLFSVKTMQMIKPVVVFGTRRATLFVCSIHTALCGSGAFFSRKAHRVGELTAHDHNYQYRKLMYNQYLLIVSWTCTKQLGIR